MSCVTKTELKMNCDITNSFTVKPGFFSPSPLKWHHKDKKCNHIFKRDDIYSLEDAGNYPIQAKKNVSSEVCEIYSCNWGKMKLGIVKD